MKAAQMHEVLSSYLEANPELKNKEMEIVVKEASVGPLPATSVSCVYVGFDWNKNRILLTPEESLIRTDYVDRLLQKNKRIYRIIKCTDTEMVDNPAYNHWLGKIVSDPIVDKKTGKANLRELYDKDGTKTPFDKILKTGPVSQINKSFEDGNEMIAIIADGNYIFLKEVNEAEREKYDGK